MSYCLDDLARIAAKAVDCSIVFDVSEDVTRQEYREECDVNHILRQHGFTPRSVVYGEHNFDDDLTSRMQARSVFQAWFDAAPDDVREKFPDLGSFMAAFGSGAFKTGLETPEVPSGDSSPSPSQPEAGAAG